MNKTEIAQVITEGKQFDEPILINGNQNVIGREPKRYIAEKPFELTRYEYSVIKKQPSHTFWFNIISGATGGVFLTILGKLIHHQLDKQQPTPESWEVISLVLGLGLSIYFYKFHKSIDDTERDDLIKVVNDHFKNNKQRRIYVDEEENEN